MPQIMEENTVPQWIAPDELPDLKNYKRIGVDVETRDPYLKTWGPGWARPDGGYIVGVSLAVEDKKFYLPMRHKGGGNMDPRRVTRYVRDQLKHPHIEYVMHNSLYDLGWLGRENMPVKGKVFDTMVAASLIDEYRYSYTLNAVASTYIGQQKEEDGLEAAAAEMGLDNRKIKENLWQMPAAAVGGYAEQDAALLMPLATELLRLIKLEQIENAFNVDMELLPYLVEIRRRGIRVDLDAVERAGKGIERKVRGYQKELDKMCGFPVEVFSAASVAKAFDKFRIPYPVTAKKGAPSFTKDWLEAHQSDLAKLVTTVRKFGRAKSTFIDSMLLEHQVNGRIHGQMHPSKSDDGGTRTGRFSHTDPNLGQVPARDPELGPLIRGCFLAEEGEEWGAFDYSQQEPRLTVHYAAREKLPGSEEALNYYRNDPGADYHQMVADMANIARKPAKTINLGLTYGMGGVKLCLRLGLPIVHRVELNSDGSVRREWDEPGEEGKALLAKYHAGVPFVAPLMELASNRAQNVGFIRTISGRKARFSLWDAGYGTKAFPRWKALKEYRGKRIRRAYTHKGLNTLIQGSAADQTKKAMLDCAKAGYLPLLQIHDELAFSIGDKKQVDVIKKLMVDAIPLLVPSKVDAELGKSWGDSMKGD